jgi:MFS family permease
MALRQVTLPIWLTRDVGWIMASRATRSLSQGYLGVIVPLYLVHLKFTAVSLGELSTVGAIVSAVLTLAVSVLADQYGRKPFLIIFPLLTAAGAIVFIATRNFGVILAASAVGTISRGGGGGGAGPGGPLYPAEQALIAGHTGTTNRNTVFSAFSFTSTLAGALLAGVPELLVNTTGMSVTDSHKPLFVLTSVLSVFTALLILPVHDSMRKREAGKRRQFLPRQSRKVIGRLALTNLLNGVGVGFYAPFIAYWFNVRYGEGPARIGFLFAAVSLGAAVPYLFAPALARALGLVRAVVGIRLIGVVTLGILPFMPTFPLAATVYFLRMILQRASIPLRQSYTMAVVVPEERSSAAGMSNLPSQVSAAASPLLAGYLFETVSLELPFEIGTILQFCNAALFFTLFRNIHPPEESARSRSPVATDALNAGNVTGASPASGLNGTVTGTNVANEDREQRSQPTA